MGCFGFDAKLKSDRLRWRVAIGEAGVSRSRFTAREMRAHSVSRRLLATRQRSRSRIINNINELKTFKFYQKYGFTAFMSQPSKLYLPMKAVSDLD